MSGFDFSRIQEVNRINLQPDEVVVFRVDRLTAADAHSFAEWADATPLKDRYLITNIDFTIDIINAGDEEE